MYLFFQVLSFWFLSNMTVERLNVSELTTLREIWILQHDFCKSKPLLRLVYYFSIEFLKVNIP